MIILKPQVNTGCLFHGNKGIIQERIHTGFQSFTEICHILRDRQIYSLMDEKLSKLQGFTQGEWN